MSDAELVKRLRDEHLAMTRNEAAAAIEALTAKLAQAVEALREIAARPDYRLPKPQDIARATLAGIEGEKT
jgi:hypothetical protein